MIIIFIANLIILQNTYEVMDVFIFIKHSFH